MSSYEHKHSLKMIKKVYDEARNLQHAANMLGLPLQYLIELRQIHGWPKKSSNRDAKTMNYGVRGRSLYHVIDTDWS